MDDAKRRTLELELKKMRARREEEEQARVQELTERCLPKKTLQHGAYYRGRCRANDIARWNAEKDCFFVWSHSCGAWCLETIRHPDDEKRYDVFTPFEEIAVPEKEIPLTLPT
jgi:hypothetical protein